MLNVINIIVNIKTAIAQKLSVQLQRELALSLAFAVFTETPAKDPPQQIISYFKIKRQVTQLNSSV